jgi:hypothetical protein
MADLSWLPGAQAGVSARGTMNNYIHGHHISAMVARGHYE